QPTRKLQLKDRRSPLSASSACPNMAHSTKSRVGTARRETAMHKLPTLVGLAGDVGPGERAKSAVPAGGFSTVAMVRTWIPGQLLEVIGQAKGNQLLQCCIRLWMRTEVDTK